MSGRKRNHEDLCSAISRVRFPFSLTNIVLFYLPCARCLCSSLGRDRFALADKSRGFQLENLEPFYDA